jgi:hypothetical protein
MSRRLWLVATAVCAAAAIAGFVLWLRHRPAAVELSILRGVPMHEFRPAGIEGGRGRSFSHSIYYVEFDFDEAVRQIDRDLRGWHGASPYPNRRSWYEPAGPFQFHGHAVTIRRNKVDPESQAVLGKASDSYKWVTVTVKGDLPDPNYARGLWRVVTGNKRP